MEQQTETVHENQASAQLAVVRYGYLRFIGEFEYHGDQALLPNQPVLVETDRGIELGRFLCYSSDIDRGLKVSPSQLNDYLDKSGQEYLKRNAGKLIRPANTQDLTEEHHIHADASNKKRYCLEIAERLGLKMKVVCVEHLFGGERIIFYFIAEGRIDFRELVRDLAKEYQTRIELRQIGARDEARLLADYEICGRECCCKNFLKTLRPVNMKMAKMQKATLDPSKVSGRCGRLRCCLRYEQKTYEDLLAQLPAVGSLVQTPQGVGKVKDRMVLTQLVQVIMQDDRFVTFPVEELEPATPGGREKAGPEKEMNATPSDMEEEYEASPLPGEDEGGESEALSDNSEGQSHPQQQQRPSGQGGRPDGGRRPKRNRGKKRRR